MPIEKTTAYKVGDKFCASLEMAQQQSIIDLLSPDFEDATAIASIIIHRKSELLAILSMEDGSPKPRKPRKDKGKPRKSNQPELLPAA